MVTPEQIAVVQSTWASVAPISETAADLFYGKLFEIDPSLRELFPDNMKEQKKKLMQTLAFCVNGLSDLGEIVPAVRALASDTLTIRSKTNTTKALGGPVVDSGAGTGRSMGRRSCRGLGNSVWRACSNHERSCCDSRDLINTAERCR